MQCRRNPVGAGRTKCDDLRVASSCSGCHVGRQPNARWPGGQTPSVQLEFAETVVEPQTSTSWHFSGTVAGRCGNGTGQTRVIDDRCMHGGRGRILTQQGPGFALLEQRPYFLGYIVGQVQVDFSIGEGRALNRYEMSNSLFVPLTGRLIAKCE